MKQTSYLPISIIVPTLDEAGNLDLLFRKLHKSLSTANIAYEIIIIDDHSTDDTAVVALAADPKYNVRFATKKGQPGKAFSLIEGFEMANYDLICMIDADLQYPPEVIPSMYHQLKKTDTDIILTKRHNSKTSLLRQLSTITYNYIFVRLLFGINYDTQSGLKLFKKQVLQNISLTPSPWTFDLEFIIRALEQNYSIGEHQIAFAKRHSGVAKLRMISATIELTRASIRLKRQTASKLVKLSYDRNLQFLQRTSVWIVALLAVVITAGLVPGSHANALSPSLSTRLADTVSSLGQTVTNTTSQLAGTSQSSSVGPSSSSTSSAGSSSASNATTSSTTPTSASQIVVTKPSNQIASDTSKDTKLMDSSDISGNSGYTGSSPSTTQTNPQIGSDTNTANNVSYYKKNKLSSSATQRFLKLALILVEIGAGFILLSVIVLISKRLTKRQRQTLRSISQ